MDESFSSSQSNLSSQLVLSGNDYLSLCSQAYILHIQTACKNQSLEDPAVRSRQFVLNYSLCNQAQ